MCAKELHGWGVWWRNPGKCDCEDYGLKFEHFLGPVNIFLTYCSLFGEEDPFLCGCGLMGSEVSLCIALLQHLVHSVWIIYADCIPHRDILDIIIFIFPQQSNDLSNGVHM